MVDILRSKEEELEKAKLEDEIQGYRTSKEEKKALEKEARKRYGRDWKKLLGVAGGLISPEVKQTLYSINPELRDLSKPNKFRRL